MIGVRTVLYWLVIFPLGMLYGFVWGCVAGPLSFLISWYMNDGDYVFAKDFTCFVLIGTWNARP